MPAADTRQRRHAGALSLALAAALLAPSPAGADLVPEADARRVGLTRAWFTQAAVARSHGGVAGAVIADGLLLVLSDAGRLQAIDAETGAPVWSLRAGDPGLVSLGPTERGDLCAIVQGATLLVYRTEDGVEELRSPIPGAPGAAPALTDEHAFLPLLRGRMLGVPLPKKEEGEQQAPRRAYASSGVALDAPAAIGERVLWATERGFVYAADPGHEGAEYRFDCAGEPIGPVVGNEKSVFVATREGRMYAIDTERGRESWRVSIGGRIDHSPVLLGDAVYLASDEPALYAADAGDGSIRWIAPGADRFVAASADRVYAVGPGGRLIVIDAKSGDPVDQLVGIRGLTPVTNTRNDRLYFLSDDGLVQCLREIDATEPFRHTPDTVEAPGDDDEGGDPQPPAEPPAFDPPAEQEPVDDPFGDDPFGAPPADDADPDGADDDPFSDPFGF